MNRTIGASSFCRHHQLVDHDQRGLPVKTVARLPGLVQHRRKNALNRIRRADMCPVFSRKVIERNLVLSQLVDRFAIFQSLGCNEEIKSDFGRLPCLCQTDILELDLKVEWPLQLWHLLSSKPQQKECQMAWNETTQEQYKRPMDRFETDVTDAEWAIIAPLIPPASKMGRPRKHDVRVIFNAVQFMLGTGCQWRSIPKCFPPFTTIQNYFYAWRDKGVLERMMDSLRSLARKHEGRSAEPTAAAIDSQSVKTTEMGGPVGYDAGKRIKGRKRHITVDTEGFPIVIVIQEASVQDRDGALEVILGMHEKAPRVTKLWADGGYAGPKLKEALKERGLDSIIEIVEKPKERKGFTLLQRCWVVERSFAWMSRCRRLAKDFERTQESSSAWVQLAACRFLIRRVAKG